MLGWGAEVEQVTPWGQRFASLSVVINLAKEFTKIETPSVLKLEQKLQHHVEGGHVSWHNSLASTCKIFPVLFTPENVL